MMAPTERALVRAACERTRADTEAVVLALLETLRLAVGHYPGAYQHSTRVALTSYAIKRSKGFPDGSKQLFDT